MTSLDYVVAISLAVLAVSFLGIFIVLIPIGVQLTKLISSMQHLVNNLNDEIQPVVKELRASFDNVKTVVNKCSNSTKDVIDKTKDTVVSITHGVLTGLKAFFKDKGSKSRYNDVEDSVYK